MTTGPASTSSTKDSDRYLSDQLLRRDVRMLGFELGLVITRHGSPQLFHLVEDVRRISKARRAGETDADAQLRQRIASLDEQQIADLIRALSCFFDLANLAEDRHRSRILRHRELQLHPAPRTESIGAALQTLQSRGFTTEQVQQLLDRLDIELVFTAHPTEAKRRTVRTTIRRLRHDLIEIDREDLLPRERERLLSHIRSNLDCLWETDALRPRKPTVLEEVRRSLIISESLWDVVPDLYRSLRQALHLSYPDHPFRLPVFLRFGTWIGGDRDGNPFVTTEVTRTTLCLLRDAALAKHRQQCDRLLQVLSISSRRHPVSQKLRDALAAAIQRWPQVAQEIQPMNPHEVYRHWLVAIRHRLVESAKADPFESLPEAGYSSPQELYDDLNLIAQSLSEDGHHALADGELHDWMDRTNVFGFQLARLDIREDARRFQSAVAELMKQIKLTSDYASLDEAGKQHLLTQPLSREQAAAIDLSSLTAATRETYDLFILIQRTVQTLGISALGAMIASMTHRPSDVLTMLWLRRLAAVLTGDSGTPAAIPIVPLFETIDDLQHAHETLDGLLACPAYAEHVRACNNLQICMVGYSDSTKDGGYLSANWELYEAQRRVAQIGRKHGIEVVFFHGRGGALGRGGGPAARGILSLPPESVGGKIRITEQGEVLAERYDDPEIAYRHLEQVTWATMLVSAKSNDGVHNDWLTVTAAASNIAFACYRRLVNDPGFLPYFEQATPIDSIESLPIGSRPSRRGGQRQMQDLRAIPYTFAWTQNRHLITAFYGLGTALHEVSHGDWKSLSEMYERWPFFRALIDNAELALAKCDMAIAHHYAQLVHDTAAGERVWSLIHDEYQRTRQAILAISGKQDLLAGTPWLQRSIRVRNPYVDPLNVIQVQLMRRLRELRESGGTEANIEQLRDILRLSVQGIAAGLRTTG